VIQRSTVFGLTSSSEAMAAASSPARYLPAQPVDAGDTSEERFKRSIGNTPGHSLRLVTDETPGDCSDGTGHGPAQPAEGERNA
jgi:hypothetical protein